MENNDINNEIKTNGSFGLYLVKLSHQNYILFVDDSAINIPRGVIDSKGEEDWGTEIGSKS